MQPVFESHWSYTRVVVWSLPRNYSNGQRRPIIVISIDLFPLAFVGALQQLIGFADLVVDLVSAVGLAGWALEGLLVAAGVALEAEVGFVGSQQHVVAVAVPGVPVGRQPFELAAYFEFVVRSSDLAAHDYSLPLALARSLVVVMPSAGLP